MKYADIPPVMRNALGTHECFRKLKFSADDIFVELARNPKAPPKHLGVFVSLKLDAEVGKQKSFSVLVGFWANDPKSVKRFSDLWKEIVHAVNSHGIADADLDRCVAESEPRKDSVAFVLGLMSRGMLSMNEREVTMADGRAIVFEMDAPCALCGGLLSIGKERDGAKKTFIAHSTPTCAKYDELSADNFLKHINDALTEARRLSTN